MSGLRITVLVENTAQRRGVYGEHGLSFWLETGGRRILFDAGQSEILFHNAQTLGITLPSLDALVLSHGHYDHTGGVDRVLRNAEGTSVFMHPDALTENYARNQDGTGRYAGISEQNRRGIAENAETVEAVKPVEIAEGFSLTGPIPRLTDFEDTGGPFYKDAECTEEDTMQDDQAAFVDTAEGVAVILGCAHAGVINTLLYVKELLPKRPIYTVIGGMHLVNAGASRMAKTVETLRELNVKYLFPLHCTGFHATARLWKEFPDQVASAPVGSRLEL